MDEDLQLWTVRAFDDAAARVALPARHRWIPRERTRAGGSGAILALAGVAALVLGAVLIFAGPRTGVGAPKSRAPTPYPTLDLTQLPGAAQWGSIWSVSNGFPVLRPTWLPKREGEYEVSSANLPATSGISHYSVTYGERPSSPGETIRHIDFLANRLPFQGRGYHDFGTLTETLTIRGQAAEVYFNGSEEGWTLVWNEYSYWYAIEAFGVSREELLRIAESLAPVIDDTGRTGR